MDTDKNTKTKSYKYDFKCKKTTSFKSVNIKTSDDAYKYALQFWKSDINIYESCFIMLLDRAKNVIGWAKISQGGVATTIMDVRIICKYAIETLSSSVILLHNHPSGSVEPSPQDKHLTQQIKDGLNVFGIYLDDHLVMSEEEYFSFCDKGLL